MVWGYAKGFVIEYVGKPKHKKKDDTDVQRAGNKKAIDSNVNKKKMRRRKKKDHIKENENKPIRIIRKEDCRKLHLNFCTNFNDIDNDRENTLLEIELGDGKKRRINSCVVGDEIYVLTNTLNPERLKIVIDMFQ